jgi:hypothetical protein
MTENKARELFDLVEQKTRDSQLEWKETDIEDVYGTTTASGFVLKIYPYTIYVEEEPKGAASLTLYDSGDHLVFDITEDLVESRRLNELYANVKRRALGTDEKLQVVINDLSNL